MNSNMEYVHVLEHLYDKSLMLHDPSLWHPVLYFYHIDALAHIDYTAGILAFNIQSPKNIMAAQYMRWRIDEEKKGDRIKFPGFISWLKENFPDKFERLPTLWRRIYDPADRASYRSFRIIPDPDSKSPVSPHVFLEMTDDFFEPEFLKSLYMEGSLSTLFEKFKDETKS